MSNLASEYYLFGRIGEAKKIYYGLWSYIEKSSIDRIYHISEYRLLAYNMGVLEGKERNFVKAKEILDYGIRSCMMAGRDEMLPRFLYCLGWVMEQEECEENAKKARHVVKQAFYLADLLKLPNLSNEICDYYEEKWNDKITC